MAGVFMLWRGALMSQEWINDYEQNCFTRIKMPGNNSCTKDLKVAMKNATENATLDQKSVLFVVSCQNYKMYQGRRLNNEAIHAYPSECEVLLKESCDVIVLTVDRDVRINNPNPGYGPFNGNFITIIHLLN